MSFVGPISAVRDAVAQTNFFDAPTVASEVDVVVKVSRASGGTAGVSASVLDFCGCVLFDGTIHADKWRSASSPTGVREHSVVLRQWVVGVGQAVFDARDSECELGVGFQSVPVRRLDCCQKLRLLFGDKSPIETYI
jgi:hypothetical protein